MSGQNPVATPAIAGYDYGSLRSAMSPLSEIELSELEQTVGWTSADADLLLRHAELFRTNAESIVDSWRAAIGSQGYLLLSFTRPDGRVDDDYKASVKRRFVQWVSDAVERPHDRDWLNYQHEIGLRHSPVKKNVTDGAHTPSAVPFRYLRGFVPRILFIRPFLENTFLGEGELQSLEKAWTKTVLLHVTLWSRAYIRDDLW